jgi:hypothetical protein
MYLAYPYKTDGSPSSAAAQVLARNTNGWMEWENKKGKTLEKLKRK